MPFQCFTLSFPCYSITIHKLKRLKLRALLLSQSWLFVKSISCQNHLEISSVKSSTVLSKLLLKNLILDPSLLHTYCRSCQKLWLNKLRKERYICINSSFITKLSSYQFQCIFQAVKLGIWKYAVTCCLPKQMKRTQFNLQFELKLIFI